VRVPLGCRVPAQLKLGAHNIDEWFASVGLRGRYPLGERPSRVSPRAQAPVPQPVRSVAAGALVLDARARAGLV